jgi:hypothetical protein
MGSATTKDYVSRLRVQYDAAGNIDFVEVTKRRQYIEDGKVSVEKEIESRSIRGVDITADVAAIIKKFDAAVAAEDAAAAERERLKKDAEEKAAIARKAAEDAAAADAAAKK